MKTFVLVLVAMAAGCGRERGDDDDDIGGEGEGEGEQAFQDFLDLCLAGTERRREVFCSGDDELCEDERQFLEWSEGVCLEEMTAWRECIATSAIYDDCTDDCSALASPLVDCQVAYCQDNQAEPECDCSFHGGPGCPPPPPP